MSRWNWIRHEGEKLSNIGVNDDGTLHNPNGYPPETVRAAVAAAEQRRHERHSKAARKAAETRRARREKGVYNVARRIIDGKRCGQRKTCCICGRGLGDAGSIERGIGSECWQDVLNVIRELAAAAQDGNGA